MSDRVEDVATVDERVRRGSRYRDEADPAAGAYLIGVLLLAVGAAAIGLSFRDPATALGLALIVPGLLLVIGAVTARRRAR